MEAKNESLSARESLSIIESMIREAKGKMSYSSFYFLLWGWVIAICNFGMYGLMAYSDYPAYAPAVWLLAIPAWIMTMIYGARQTRAAGTVSHLDKISMWLWICMAISITPAWIFGAKINWMVNAIVLMPVGAATFVSGVIIRFNALKMGGVIFWVAGVLCYFVAPVDQYLVGGVAMILGYLLPGYLLRYQKESNA